jgi:ArsR family transcriptional regulator, arsenate/arsenite/antimonite-responsive transcriptional repressor
MSGEIGWRDFAELKLTLRRIGNNVSLNILHQLAGQHEITVTDLVAALGMGISQPLVSWHLRNLRRVGLVRTRRHGREVYCSLDMAQFAAVQRALGEVVTPPASVAAVDGADGAPPASSGVALGLAPPSPQASGAGSRPNARAGPDTG